jgi:hypothetical protein
MQIARSIGVNENTHVEKHLSRITSNAALNACHRMNDFSAYFYPKQWNNAFNSHIKRRMQHR